MPRAKKQAEDEVDEGVGVDVLDDEVDPEEQELTSDLKKARLKERLVRTEKRTIKAEREKEAIEEGDDEEITSEGNKESYLGKFGAQLRDNEGWVVYVERSHPRKLQGKDLPRSIAQFDTPCDLEELKQEIETEHGGGRYKLTIKDDDYRFRGRRQVTVTGPPKPPASWSEEEEDMMPTLTRRGMQFDEDEEEEFDEVSKLKKAIQVAELEQRLARVAGNGKDEGREDLEEKMMKLLEERDQKHEREMERLRHQSEIEDLRSEMRRMSEARTSPDVDALREMREEMNKRDQDHKEEMARIREERLRDESRAQMDLLKTQIVDMKEGGQKSGNSEMMALMMKAMESGSSRSEANTNALVSVMGESMKTQVTQMQTMVGKLMEQKDPGSKTNELKDFAETIVSVGGVLGMGPGGGEEPKDFGTSLVNAVEKIVPQVLTEMSEGRKAMAGMTAGQIPQLVGRMTEEIKREVRQSVAGAGGAPPPAPSMAPPSHSERVGGPGGGPGVGTARSPQPIEAEYTGQEIDMGEEPMGSESIAGDQVPETQAPPAAPTAPGVPSVEEERVQRMNLVLDYLVKDMQILPGEPTWTYAAWQVLPDDIRMGIVRAASDEDVYNAIKDEGDISKLTAIWDYISKSQKHRQFLIKGINQIKAWYKAGGPPNATAGQQTAG